jgi:hypothetical protein
MWRCIYSAITWAVLVVFGILMLWIERDGRLPRIGFLWWVALAPGPILVALAIVFRVVEQPRPFNKRKIDYHVDGPVIR